MLHNISYLLIYNLGIHSADGLGRPGLAANRPHALSTWGFKGKERPPSVCME